jgi:RNA polymerase subunit RPABC4/transcription elongation factor Spt4
MPPNDCPDCKRLTDEWSGLRQSINQQNYHNRLVSAQKTKEAKQAVQRLEEKAAEAYRALASHQQTCPICKGGK